MLMIWRVELGSVMRVTTGEETRNIFVQEKSN